MMALSHLTASIPDETSLASLRKEYKDHSRFAGKIAVVGFGKMGALHATILKMLNRETEVAVVDESKLVRTAGSTFLNGVKFYGALDKMLTKENPDVVYITTPASTHFDVISILAASTVESIFVEKPPTKDSSQLAKLTRLLGKRRVVMVGLQKRFALPFRHLKQLTDAGALGNLESVEASIESGDVLAETTRFDKLGRGCLLDLGIHTIDLINWLFGPVTVSTADATSVYTKLDDTVNAVLRERHGAVIKLKVSWSSKNVRWPSARIRVAGSGTVVDACEDSLLLTPLGKEGRFISKPAYYRDLAAVNLADPEYTLEDMHFVSCVSKGEEPETSLRMSETTMKLIDEIYSMVQLGKSNSSRR